MEKYGIFYFFEQSESGEKVVFGDAPSCFPPSNSDTQLTFRRVAGAISESMNITAFSKRDLAKPTKVFLQDYNWQNPDASLMLDTDIEGPGQGVIYSYGHHFKEKSEGQDLAKVMAEAEFCHAHFYEGESDCIFLSAGQQFSQSEHPISGFNGDFTVTKITHELSLANSSLDAFEEMDFQTSYRNRFRCIEAKTSFKGLLKTKVPKIHGFVYGVVDGDGNGKRAEINDYGQYKVRLYFDLRDEKPASASCFVRKSEVYGGSDMGMHHPLLKGTEVLVGFSHGDVDRPIIVGVMPNSKLKSVVTGSNKTSNVIKSASGITVTMYDGDG
jgi:type VI secretion system secreted protein VgrG